ncbi:MAG TPA: pyruvate formate lyase family protein [Candidatus Latescibacteria bacterium]|jgi:formate C-acetyltransferase|nr:pyruvate formate lyase family protein [Candidatus Latescibacterota bacterium]
MTKTVSSASPTIPPSRETPLGIADRIAAIRQTKMAQTAEKQRVVGAMDYDDWALILPPENRREMVQSVSGSGVAINDVLLAGVEMESNHENGGFYGAAVCGANFRRLLEAHPPYVDPASTLAGGYMANFGSYRKHGWNPDIPVPADLQARRKKYELVGAIGATQHFCQDLQIGLDLGWAGLLEKITAGRAAYPNDTERQALYDGLTEVVLGMQAWGGSAAAEARRLATTEPHPQLRDNLSAIAEMNERLVTEKPATFREACQWMLWFDMAARMYNGSGSLGRLDVLLTPYYERESAAGTLSDEEAVLHIASLLARDTAYLQIGGPDPQGRDVTNRVSYLILEAAHQLKIPCNVGLSVGDGVDHGLLQRGVEILVEDRLGIPKFLGVDRTTEGFVRNGVSAEVARGRAYSGCHWSALPGREYTLNDCVKISFGNVFDIALRDMIDTEADPSTDKLWAGFERHMREAVLATAESIDFHLKHMKGVFPELVMDLLCHGTIEQGLDASDGFGGGLEHYNMCVDGCALATVADSFAAVEEHVERSQRLTWTQLIHHLDENWQGDEGERTRLLMRRIPRYGAGGGRADAWAVRISEMFSEVVKEKTTPAGFCMIPGIFSWANTIPLGGVLGATPNGRHAGDAISHGANPDPGFRQDGAPTAMAVAIAAVQPGYGNTAPMQLELDPGAVHGEQAVDNVVNLIRTHFEIGGTQINLNVLDRDKVLEAHEDPSKYPDLVVRVTGFSAYFASLSPEFRQLVVDRILSES